MTDTNAAEETWYTDFTDKPPLNFTPIDTTNWTEQKRTILLYLAKGYNVREIGAALEGRSRFTIADHVQEIYASLGIHNRADATKAAIRAGLINVIDNPEDLRLKDLIKGYRSLCAQERKVFHLLAEGKTKPEVATALGISRNTVASYVKEIYRNKLLGMGSEPELVCVWVNLKLAADHLAAKDKTDAREAPAADQAGSPATELQEGINAPTTTISMAGDIRPQVDSILTGRSSPREATRFR